MKRKNVTKMVWIFVTVMIIFTMVLWTIGAAFM
jgi:predicted nucleic acid-binding Zn ribbon protein